MPLAGCRIFKSLECIFALDLSIKVDIFLVIICFWKLSWPTVYTAKILLMVLEDKEARY